MKYAPPSPAHAGEGGAYFTGKRNSPPTLAEPVAVGMRRRPLVRSQGAMRTAFGVAVHHTVAYSGVTPSNLGGTATSGPFPPTAPETYALWALCNEYAMMHVLCMHADVARKRESLDGYDEAVARPFARARSRARPRRERRACAGP